MPALFPVGAVPDIAPDAAHALFIIITLDFDAGRLQELEAAVSGKKQEMFVTSTKAAPVRAPHHNTRPDRLPSQAKGQRFAATPRHQPEASTLTPAEIRRIVQDILG
ncbi:hypothetical protein [Roseomonas elaeocarpi]|uniref:Uncharacterized protein n=1 Tax=Roseomonas elaeocarpi TaxID=907779 RepID=A0ABV6JRM1_9PROT